MPLWLDRLWTYTVWVAFLFMAPLWVALWWQRHPLLGVTQILIIGYPLFRECRAELRRKTPKNDVGETLDLLGAPTRQGARQRVLERR